MPMKLSDFLNDGEVESIRILQEKLKASTCYDERKRLVTKKAIEIEKARIKKEKQQ
jgi:hypothetical protein